MVLLSAGLASLGTAGCSTGSGGGGGGASAAGSDASPSSPSVRPLVASTFDVDAEGWRVSGNGEDTVPEHRASGGQAGGYIHMDFTASEEVGYWRAPEKFLGDVSEAIGGRLTFATSHGGPASAASTEPLVVLTAETGLQLVYPLPTDAIPSSGWADWSVGLQAGAGWRTAETLSPASAGELAEVVAGLTRLEIRGEYAAGPDGLAAGLDSVEVWLPEAEHTPADSTETMADDAAELAALLEDTTLYLTDHTADPLVMRALLPSGEIVDYLGSIDEAADTGTRAIVVTDLNEERYVLVLQDGWPQALVLPDGTAIQQTWSDDHSEVVFVHVDALGEPLGDAIVLDTVTGEQTTLSADEEFPGIEWDTGRPRVEGRRHRDATPPPASARATASPQRRDQMCLFGERSVAVSVKDCSGDPIPGYEDRLALVSRLMLSKGGRSVPWLVSRHTAPEYDSQAGVYRFPLKCRDVPCEEVVDFLVSFGCEGISQMGADGIALTCATYSALWTEGLSVVPCAAIGAALYIACHPGIQGPMSDLASAVCEEVLSKEPLPEQYLPGGTYQTVEVKVELDMDVCGLGVPGRSSDWIEVDWQGQRDVNISMNGCDNTYRFLPKFTAICDAGHFAGSQEQVSFVPADDQVSQDIVWSPRGADNLAMSESSYTHDCEQYDESADRRYTTSTVEEAWVSIYSEQEDCDHHRIEIESVFDTYRHQVYPFPESDICGKKPSAQDVAFISEYSVTLFPYEELTISASFYEPDEEGRWLDRPAERRRAAIVAYAQALEPRTLELCSSYGEQSGEGCTSERIAGSIHITYKELYGAYLGLFEDIPYLPPGLIGQTGDAASSAFAEWGTPMMLNVTVDYDGSARLEDYGAFTAKLGFRCDFDVKNAPVIQEPRG